MPFSLNYLVKLQNFPLLPYFYRINTVEVYPRITVLFGGGKPRVKSGFAVDRDLEKCKHVFCNKNLKGEKAMTTVNRGFR